MSYPQKSISYPQDRAELSTGVYIVYNVSVLSYPQESVLLTTTKRDLLFF